MLLLSISLLLGFFVVDFATAAVVDVVVVFAAVVAAAVCGFGTV